MTGRTEDITAIVVRPFRYQRRAVITLRPVAVSIIRTALQHEPLALPHSGAAIQVIGRALIVTMMELHVNDRWVLL